MATHRLEDWVLHKLFPKLVPTHRPLSDAENLEFLERRAQMRLEPFRAYVYLSAIMLVLFIGWDWAVDSAALLKNLPIRIAAALLISIYARQLPQRCSSARLDRAVFGFVFLYTALLAYLISQISHGMELGVSGLLILPTTFGMLFADSRKILTLTIAWALPAGLAVYHNVNPMFIGSQLLFAVTALGSAWIGARIHEAASGRQFQIRQELEHQASTDSLTGLLNRRAVTRWAEEEFARTQRYHRPLTVLLLDIDFFKKINDRFGHDVGDHVITRLADICKSSLRSTDQVCRWGGEEFLVILPETALAQAMLLAERLRLSVEQAKVESSQGDVTFTISLGLAQLESGVNFEELVDHADQALYQSKQQGRNRSLCFELRNRIQIQASANQQDCC